MRTPVMLARHRVGVSDSFTAGGRVEMHPGRLISGGPSVNVRLPFGEVETAGSVSRRQEQWGSAAQTSFTHTGHPISAGGSVRVASALRHPHTESGQRRSAPSGRCFCEFRVGARGQRITPAHADKAPWESCARPLGPPHVGSPQPQHGVHCQRRVPSATSAVRAKRRMPA